MGRRDQSWVFAYWFRALRPVGVPYFRTQMENGERDRWEDNGRSPFVEVERNGSVFLPAAATACVRQLQKLRGSFARRILRRQRRGDAWKGRDLRKERGGSRWWQEKMRDEQIHVTYCSGARACSGSSE